MYQRLRTSSLIACLFIAVGAQGGDVKPSEPLKAHDLTGWRAPTGGWTLVGEAAVDPHDHSRLIWNRGDDQLVNGSGGRTSNLLTREEFGDVQAHLEFMIPARSNSGVYFMGRYELQIYDSFGIERDEYPGIECGGIYPRWINERNVEGHSPSVNASRPPGQWQTFDVTFHAPRFDAAGHKTADAVFVKVVHNGRVIQENVAVSGPTRSAAFDDEKPVGPTMLQGDHGPVVFRNIRIESLATSNVQAKR